MKKCTLYVLTLFGLSLLSFSRPALAHDKEKMAEHIQVMRDAADALQATRPDLAGKLDEFAEKKEKWCKKKGKGHKEHKKHMVQKKEDIQKIRQAAEELKGNNDSIAKDLKEIAERWEKKLEKKKK